MTPHKWAKEIHAFADGFEIEENYPLGVWYPQHDPRWNDAYRSFRIKTRHQAVKDAFEAGAQVEMYQPSGEVWWPCPSPTWRDYCEYRIKERVFPVTSLSDNTLRAIAANAPQLQDTFRVVANAAIKQYILDQEKLK